MCIRDSHDRSRWSTLVQLVDQLQVAEAPHVGPTEHRAHPVCLLYTSDAADERSSVDLGGRRIIKKKIKDGIRKGGPR